MGQHARFPRLDCAKTPHSRQLAAIPALDCAKTPHSRQLAAFPALNCAKTPHSRQLTTIPALDCAKTPHSWQLTAFPALDCAKNPVSVQLTTIPVRTCKARSSLPAPSRAHSSFHPSTHFGLDCLLWHISRKCVAGAGRRVEKWKIRPEIDWICGRVWLSL